MTTRRAMSVMVALALVLAAIGLWPGTSRTRPRSVSVGRLPHSVVLASALQPFDSCDALLAWVKREGRARVTAYGLEPAAISSAREIYSAQNAGATVTTGVASPNPADRGAANSAQASPYSTTNVQVAGVDEPDVVKTDGSHIVSLVNGRLYLVDTNGARPVVADSLALPGSYNGQLLLDGNRVFVFTGNVGPIAEPMVGTARDSIALPPNADGARGASVVEVTIEGDHFHNDGSIDLGGAYVAARQIGDTARVVVRADPQDAIGFVSPRGTGPAALANALAANRAALNATTIDDWLPHYTVRDAAGMSIASGPLVPCDGARHPASFAGFGTLNVVTLDLTRPLTGVLRAGAGAAVLAGGDTVYASATHLYVATTDWPAAIAPTVTNGYGVDIVAPSPPTSTAIHEFDISNPTSTRYVASGNVDGTIVDQYAMDERGGFLRVATTTGASIEPNAVSVSQVRVLETDGDALVQVGEVGGLGHGETIQSVRFVDDEAYVVTYRQTDPLYTVDLSDPTRPRVVGALQLLGFSSYLHPVAKGYLLGVGQDANEHGIQSGVQLALFDVRDPANPQRVARVTIPGTSSAVQWDPHAFLWWAPSSLAIVPVDALGSTAAIGYTVDTARGAIGERGRIDSTIAGNDQRGASGPPSGASNGSTGSAPGAGTAIVPMPFSAAILRTVVIGTHVFSVSSAGVIESDVATLHTVATVPFGS